MPASLIRGTCLSGAAEQSVAIVIIKATFFMDAP